MRINWLVFICRSSSLEVFSVKVALKNFAKFTGKHLCQRLFFNKEAGLRRNNFNPNISWLLDSKFKSFGNSYIMFTLLEIMSALLVANKTCTIMWHCFMKLLSWLHMFYCILNRPLSVLPKILERKGVERGKQSFSETHTKQMVSAEQFTLLINTTIQ